jgi:hypothetical protein
VSASASQSNPTTTTTSTQQSVQGAAGANSPTNTITSAGPVNYNDPALGLSAIGLAGQTIQQVLQAQGALSAQVAQSGAQQQSSVGDAVSQLLSQQQSLLSAVGTGGASLTTGTNNTVIYGAIAIAIAAVLGIFFSKK